MYGDEIETKENKIWTKNKFDNNLFGHLYRKLEQISFKKVKVVTCDQAFISFSTKIKWQCVGTQQKLTVARIPHPASRIPHPASRIPHPASRIPHPASRIPPPATRLHAAFGTGKKRRTPDLRLKHRDEISPPSSSSSSSFISHFRSNIYTNSTVW